MKEQNKLVYASTCHEIDRTCADKMGTVLFMYEVKMKSFEKEENHSVLLE